MRQIILSILLISLGLFCVSVSAEVSVIVNKSNGNEFAKKDISRIFLGKTKSFADGGKITPFNLQTSNPARKAFEKNVLNKSASQIKAFWSKQIFTGKGKPPKEKASDADVISLVSSTPGAIGYVDSASVTDAVKVVATF